MSDFALTSGSGSGSAGSSVSLRSTNPAGGGGGGPLQIVKPIVYGNISKHFGKKRESDGHTHEWTVYVKPFHNEDMSTYVKKVQFKLHESYATATRVVSKPPYEVSETGWGEFEIQVKIYFNDASERSISVYPLLKLFPNPADPTTTTAIVQGRRTVVCEYYDEIIFQEPSQYIHTLLTTTRPITLDAYKHETDFDVKQRKTTEAIREGREKVQSEISDLKERLQLARETIAKFKTELSKAQKERAQEFVGVTYD